MISLTTRSMSVNVHRQAGKKARRRGLLEGDKMDVGLCARQK